MTEDQLEAVRCVVIEEVGQFLKHEYLSLEDYSAIHKALEVLSNKTPSPVFYDIFLE